MAWVGMRCNNGTIASDRQTDTQTDRQTHTNTQFARLSAECKEHSGHNTTTKTGLFSTPACMPGNAKADNTQVYVPNENQQIHVWVPTFLAPDQESGPVNLHCAVPPDPKTNARSNDGSRRKAAIGETPI